MEKLDELFSQLDDWFTDITLGEPISQFALENEDINNQNPTSRPNPSTLVKTQSNKRKPARQVRANSQRQRRTDNKNSLDSLTRDLEELLEKGDIDLLSEKVEAGPETFMHEVYSDDDETLLDDTVGHCCTLSKPAKLSHYYHPVVINHMDDDSCDTRIDAARNVEMEEENNQRIFTVPPPDHDYIPRLSKSRPLSSNNTLIKSQNQRRNRTVIAASMMAPPPSCVLNMEALKRFARFSDRIEMLTKIES